VTPLCCSGATIVLPDRVLSPGSIVIEGDRIVEVTAGARPRRDGVAHFDYSGHVIVPGFIDVHVHGVEGFDTLASDDAVEQMARRLLRFGVTAFCPTTIACSPGDLTRVVEGMRRARTQSASHARVLGAHLESNFINPDYKGAQPLVCLRRPPLVDAAGRAKASAADEGTGDFTGADVMRVIEANRADIGILTIAPELPDALDLIRALVAAGHHVSLGHSGATFDQGLAGIGAGATQATHLFNRMPPLSHREPGLVGAILGSEAVAAEVICDRHHVHPTIVHTAIRAKRAERMMAITDGLSGAGLPVGTRVALGDRQVTVTPHACYLDDGTLAGSSLTMDGAFRMLVEALGLGLVEAATMCATTQARELGLTDQGIIAPGAVADLAVLDRNLRVVQTIVGGAPTLAT
jgi:N-acetylglucosamine-6-phosphate deacetylase